MPLPNGANPPLEGAHSERQWRSSKSRGRCKKKAVSAAGIQARRRAAYLDQVAQDLLHFGSIGDDGQHSHF